MDKRVYLVTKRINEINRVVGIFTNQKRTLEGINRVVDIDQLYICGAKKKKQVNSINLNIELQSPKRVDIFDKETDDVCIQITQIGLNHVNPKLVIGEINNKEVEDGEDE